MSDTTPHDQAATQRDGDRDGTSETPFEDLPQEETPPVAGGRDDSRPAQGEGAHDSY